MDFLFNNYTVLLLVCAVTLIASIIQGTTGFGFGIFAMIFLPRILVYTEANVLSTMLSSMTSLLVAVLGFKNINWKNTVFPVIGCILSTYLAVSFIKTQSSDTLMLLLGVALFLLSVYFFFFTDKIKIRPTWYAGLIAGILSGILGGMFSIGGPPVVVYYMQSEEDPKSYVTTISAYFVLSGAVSVATKAAAGFVTNYVLWGFAIGIIGMLLGSFVGKSIREHVKPKVIKKIVYGFMAVSGIVNVITAII